ncbi:Disease resistance-like protein DSC1 [Citrus sinensis]|uniref:Disease resistance-like protein DSC1 n=1 Tax=Citrus sinensis TaxID=2711 RepID=A0ACB8MBK4_CITSI|nr:Disease resistance-like protein DSC1 [Citrus sinensis]
MFHAWLAWDSCPHVANLGFGFVAHAFAVYQRGCTSAPPICPTVSRNRLQMHDLLQEMGLEIVRQESEKEPGRRSRLWDHKEIRHILNDNKAFEALDMSTKVQLPDGLDYLPKKLKYLYWRNYPLRTLPSNFKPKNLVELNLPYGHKVVQIWEGKKRAFKLKFINLSHSQCHIKIPDPSETPNLERIDILNCTNPACVLSSITNFNHLKFPQISGNIIDLILTETAIEEVPSSTECLTNLQYLFLCSCKKLKRVSTSICKFKSLVWLSLNKCLNLESFPESMEKMEHLNRINLGRTTITEQLPSSFENVEGLETQCLECCSELDNLPGYSDLTAIPQEIGCLSSLECLNLGGNNFEGLPASIKQISRLECLDLSYCNSLQSLPELPLHLEVLLATNCKRLQSLPEIPSCLEELDASVLEKLSKHSFGEEYRIWSIKFNFTNCLKLMNEEANKKNLADSRLRIQHMAIASLRLFWELRQFSLPLNRYHPLEHRENLRGATIILPGNNVPEWFINRSSGSEITLQLPQHCCQNLMGFAVCAVLQQIDEERDCFFVDFLMKTLSGRKIVRCYETIALRRQVTKTNVILGFRPLRNVGFPDDNNRTVVPFKFSSQYYVVKCCGVCPVYASPNETKPNTITLNFATEISKLDDRATASESESSSGEEELEPSPNRLFRDDHVNIS